VNSSAIALDDSSDEEDDLKVTKKSETDQDRRIRLEIEESRKRPNTAKIGRNMTI